jgi:hypothetical protein
MTQVSESGWHDRRILTLRRRTCSMLEDEDSGRFSEERQVRVIRLARFSCLRVTGGSDSRAPRVPVAG